MTYSPLMVENFRGINLTADPGEVGLGGAVDALNVDLDLPGSVRSRDGYRYLGEATLGGAPSGAPAGASHMTTAPSSGLLAFSYRDGATQKVGVYSNGIWAGGVTALPTNVAFDASSICAYETPTDSRIYATSGTAVQRFSLTGAAWTDVSAATPDGVFAGVTPVSNRLVLAGPLANPNRVQFSDPGAPETFGASNYIDFVGGAFYVTPWRELTFVASIDRFIVFYGESVDATGNPVFNYRTLDIPDRPLCQPAPGPDGIYYVAASGVYRLNGSGWTLVSRALTPFFELRKTLGAVSALKENYHIAAGATRLYVSIGTAAVSGTTQTRGVLVYYYATGEWTYWDLPAMDIAPAARLYSTSEIAFSPATTDKLRIADVPSGASRVTTDNGGSIASNYRTGFGQLANGLPATVRRFELTGSGTATLTAYGDHSTAAEWQGKAATAVTMGTAPAVARSYALMSGRARDLSFKVSVTSGAWSLNRWAAQVAAVRSY